MAVTIPATGSGTATPQVATDVITSVHYQILKLYDATAGSTNALIVTAAGAAKVDGSAVTQPVSGTVTANAGTGTMAVSAASLPLPAGAAQDATLTGGTQKTKLVDTGGTNVASVSAAGAVKVDGSAVTQPVSAASLPLPTGAATSAKQPALGTAGTPSADVLSVQGVASMTALKTDGSAVTQPVSIAATVKTQQTPGTTGGYSTSRLLSAATTNATSVKASAGQVYGFYLFNSAAYTVFLKLYNKASAPTVGTDTPFMTIPVPAGGGAVADWDGGIAMSTGIAFAITKLIADSDVTAVAANDLAVNLFYV